MRITYLYQSGRLMRLSGVRKGKIPTEFFYGAPELEAKGHTVRYFEVYDVPGEGLLRYLAESVIKHKYLPAKVYFALLAGVRRVLPELLDTDVVVATTPGIAFSLAIVKSLQFGRIRVEAELVAIHCGILNYSHNQVRLMGSRWLLKRMWTLLYGVGELESMVACFRIPSERIRVNCFGVDETFWTPEERKVDKGYILSIGNDLNRDYEVLLKVAENIEQKIKVVTRRQLSDNIPDNIDLIYGSWHSQALDDQEIRDLYRKALCVVVPLKESIQPSGQSVTLQAMACGAPVVLTQTSGLWEKTGLRDRENILFVRPGKAEDIVKATELLERDRQLRHKLSQSGPGYVFKHGRISQFADRVEAFCDYVISHKEK